MALLVALYLIRRRKNKAAAAERAANTNNRPPLDQVSKPWEVHELQPEGTRPELFAHNVQRPPVELYGG